jgi:hypothetical protein
VIHISDLESPEKELEEDETIVDYNATDVDNTAEVEVEETVVADDTSSEKTIVNSQEEEQSGDMEKQLETAEEETLPESSQEPAEETFDQPASSPSKDSSLDKDNSLSAPENHENTVEDDTIVEEEDVSIQAQMSKNTS